jgi:hypothetical protein
MDTKSLQINQRKKLPLRNLFARTITCPPIKVKKSLSKDLPLQNVKLLTSSLILCLTLFRVHMQFNSFDDCAYICMGGYRLNVELSKNVDIFFEKMGKNFQKVVL